MKTDGLFTTHAFKIPVQHKKPIRLVIFGDVHWDSPNHAKHSWQEDLKHFRSLKDAWFLGMGDYLDSTSTSERDCLGRMSSEMHETLAKDLNALQAAKVEAMAKEMEFMKGRLIGLLGGNHYWKFQHGGTTDTELARLLETTYLGVSTFIRLTLEKFQRRFTLDIWAHHGAGGARLPGGSLNRVDQMREHAEADIFCVDEATEILTKRGWAGRDAVAVGDEVAQLSRDTGSISWGPVLDKVEFYYSGPAVRFKNDNMDALFHPKHRVLYRYADDGPWLVREASDFLNLTGQIRIPMAGNSTGRNADVSEEQLALCGWIVAEGSFGPSGVRLYQKYEPKVSQIRESIKACRMRYSEARTTEDMTRFYIPAEHRNEIDKLLPSGKEIPEWLKSCNRAQFDAFLHTLTLGDGHYISPRSSQVYSAKESFIDDLQAACAVHGYRSSKTYKPGGFKDGGWALSVCDRSDTQFALSKPLVTQENYNGKMWCVTTDAGTFIARRNGKTFATGNCMGHDHKRGVIPATPRLHLAATKAGLKVRHRQQWLVRSGSYLASYEPGVRNYNVDAARGPCSLGHVELILTLIDQGGECKIPGEIKIQALA